MIMKTRKTINNNHKLNSSNVFNAGKYLIPDQAIKSIYRYLRIKYSINEQKEFENVEEGMNYYFASNNIHYRKVELTHGWHFNATGVMFAVLKENKEFVALIPNQSGRGYHFRDLNNRAHLVTLKNEKLFEKDAYLFYRPFKDGAIHFKDIAKFIISNVTTFELIKYALLVIATTAFGLILPHLTRWVFSQVSISADISIVYLAAILISGYVLIAMLLSCYKLFISSRLSLKISVGLEAAMMERMLSLPANFFKKYSAGDLANRFAYLNAICNVLIESIGVTTVSTVFTLVYVIQIFDFSIILALVSIGTTLLTIGFDIAVIYFAEHNIRSRITFETKESGLSYAMIAGIEKIKTAGAEKVMYNNWNHLYQKCVKLTYDPPFIIKIRSVVNLLISLGGILAVYVMAIRTQIKVADFYAFNTIYAMTTATLLSFNTASINIAKIRPYYEIIYPLLKTLPEVRSRQKYITNLKGEIKINHLSFRYESDEPYILNDISLHIKAGQEIAIVGETGAGKSTLIRLLLGFEKPEKGTIYYDQHDMNSIELKSLRHLIGTVMQDIRVFSGDVYSNIVISAPWKSTNDAWKAAEIASFDDDIKAMPMGMRTLLQEGTGGISGGQKQRLAIARAVLNNPKILIFDEATSALDNITQKKVSDAISQLKCTRIVIAHRLSTIMHADQIYVLKNGSIIEHGTYKELSKNKKGEFTKLISRQQL